MTISKGEKEEQKAQEQNFFLGFWSQLHINYRILEQLKYLWFSQPRSRGLLFIISGLILYVCICMYYMYV